jgi:glycosyltransferase involved in cell wall biosynthesis
MPEKKNKPKQTDKMLSILVPVYNEEKTLKKILKDTTSLPIEKYEVIIVDDSSKDSSPKIIQGFVKQFQSKSVTLKSFRHSVNKGKGAGIQTALVHATGEYFVIQDADLEYDPIDIPKLLSEANTNNYDVVYGSRFLGNINNMPKANYIANRGYNIILRLLYKTSVTDMHTCYKMVRTSLIKELGITSNGFGYATELVSKILKRGIDIHEVPIGFNGRTKKEGKKIDFMDGLECAFELLRFRFTSSEKLFGEKSTTFTRFMIVGGTGFVSNYLILVLLTQLAGLGHVLAEIIAAFFALHITFALHDRWTYLLHTPKGTEILKFQYRYIAYIFSNAFGSFMTVVAFGLLYEHMTRFTALLFAAILGLCWNYAMNTYVIWRGKKSTDFTER